MFVKATNIWQVEADYPNAYAIVSSDGGYRVFFSKGEFRAWAGC